MTLLCAVLTDPTEGFRISYYTIAGRINQFMIGIAMAYLIDLGLINFTRWRSLAALLVSSVAILALFTALSRNGGIYAWRVRYAFLPELEGLLWAILIFGYIGLKPLGRFGAPLMWLGQVSFSMYVLHYAIVRNWWVFLYPKTGLDLIPLPAFGVLQLSWLFPSRSSPRFPFFASRSVYFWQCGADTLQIRMSCIETMQIDQHLELREDQGDKSIHAPAAPCRSRDEILIRESNPDVCCAAYGDAADDR